MHDMWKPYEGKTVNNIEKHLKPVLDNNKSNMGNSCITIEQNVAARKSHRFPQETMAFDNNIMHMHINTKLNIQCRRHFIRN